jgi:NADPH:quinone reductase-like Zn-dependent oxidoreductase
MHAWQISSFGIDSLEFVERTDPVPGRGEILVGIRAISFNFRDLMMIKGLYNPRMKLPRVPCSDGAGEVLSVGAGVAAWKPGDRVAGIFMQNWLEGPLTPAKAKGALGGDVDGMLATHVALRETGLVAVPRHMSYQEAATLPCAAVTAWNALCSAAPKSGATVLIQGTGGVSIFALQFAKLRGLRVLGISSSDEKLARAAALGLDAGFNYRKDPDWENWVLEETGGEGVDLVIEVGGAGTLTRSLKAVRTGGTIAQIGVLAGAAESVSIPQILHKTARIQGIYVGSRQDFIEMNRAVELFHVNPLYESFPWSRARDALHHMESGSHFGKLVLTVE